MEFSSDEITKRWNEMPQMKNKIQNPSRDTLNNYLR
jgi:hypothetical protein